MAKRLYSGTLLFFLISGCAALRGLSEVETPETQTPAAAASEEPVVSVSPVPEDPIKDEASRAAASVKKPLGKEEIRGIQTRLRAAGFDPGPADGILGPKTKSALLQAQAGCTIVKDLLATSGKRVFRVTTETQSPPASASETPIEPPAESVNNEVSKPTAPVKSAFSAQEIRLAQERLKAAGFDPGPIDGKLGPQTKSALDKYRSSQGLMPSVGMESLLAY